MELDLSKIPHFLAAAEYLNFTEAANRCYITQSSLSKSIASLEESLGFSLFIRGNRKVSLTVEGAYLYEEFSKINNNLNRMVTNAVNIHEGYNGSFSMAACGYLPSNFVFQRVNTSFVLNNPMFRFAIHQETYPGLRTALMDDRVDVILTGSQNVATLRGIETLVIEEGTPVLLCNPYCYPEHPDQLRIEDFAKAKFLSVEIMDYQAFMLEVCDCYGIKPDITIVSSLAEVIYHVGNMDYVTILDRVQYPIAETNLKVVRFPKKDDMPHLDLLLAWKEENKNPALRQYIRYVENELAKVD